MKNLLKNTLTLCVLCLFLFLSSCVSDKKSKTKETDIIDAQLSGDMNDLESSHVNFKIPSPMEVFAYMKRNGSTFIPDVLNNPDNHRKYDTKQSKALNFGIYTADLAYCCVFEDFQNSITYFSVAKLLASELGLNEGYGNKMADRVSENLSNIDSLREIAVDSYFEAHLFLEEQGSADLMSLIIYGGWIETLYLATETAKLVKLEDPVFERIADQRILLENIIAYFKKNGSYPEILKDLEELEIVYDELNFNEDSVLITKKQFVDISNKTTELRNTYIQF